MVGFRLSETRAIPRSTFMVTWVSMESLVSEALYFNKLIWYVLPENDFNFLEIKNQDVYRLGYILW